MVSREYKDWERCEKNMSGIHTWEVVRTSPATKKEKPMEVVKCHRCGAQPPNVHRGRIRDEIKTALNILRQQKKAASEWRKAVRGR